MTLSVALAEQQLAQAHAEEAKQKREEAKQQREQCRREHARLLAEFLPLAARVNEAQNTRLRLNRELLRAKNQIAYYQRSPEPLSSDAQIAEHTRQLGLWRQKQKALLAENAVALECEAQRLQGVKLQQTLVHLEQVIRNLTTIIEEGSIGHFDGGVFTGVEDFLGNTQAGPPRHL